MSTILENHRARRVSIKSPAIREICLVGTPSRQYRHVPREALRAQDSGPTRERRDRIDSARIGAT